METNTTNNGSAIIASETRPHPWLVELANADGTDIESIPLAIRQLATARDISREYAAWKRTVIPSDPLAHVPDYIRKYLESYKYEDKTAQAAAKAEITKIDREYYELNLKMRQLTTKRLRMKRRLTALTTLKKDLTPHARELFETGLFDPESFSFYSDGVAQVTTKNPITINWYNRDAGVNMSVRLPVFAIEINFNTGSVKAWQSVGNDSRIAAGNYEHPHINQQMEVCLGNMRGTVLEAINSCNFKAAFVAVYSILTNYNDESPYKALTAFDRIVNPERYENDYQWSSTNAWCTEDVCNEFPDIRVLDTRDEDEEEQVLLELYSKYMLSDGEISGSYYYKNSSGNYIELPRVFIDYIKEEAY